MAGKKSVENISTELLKVHPLIENKYAVGNLVAMQFTMKSYGQKQPITVVKRKNVNYIVDGVVRYLVSGDAGITELECTVINITDEEVLDYRMKVNQFIKRSLIETASLVEHFFGLVGTSQGKKRDLLGFKDLLSMVREVTLTEISPTCVLNTVPSIPMKSPKSSSFLNTSLYKVLSSLGQSSSRLIYN